MRPARMPEMCSCAVQGGLLGMVPFDPMGQISDKNRQSEVRNGRCACASVHWPTLRHRKPCLGSHCHWLRSPACL